MKTLKLLKNIEKYRKDILESFSESIMTGKLILSNTKLESEDVDKYVIPFLTDNPDITYLDISDNDIRDRGVIFLSQINTLKYLDISRTHITDVGAIWISKNKTLTKLYIKQNDIIIKETLSKKPDLHLSITTSGAIALLLNGALEDLTFSYRDEYGVISEVSINRMHPFWRSCKL